MTTVTMEILRSIVKHHFLIVIVPILNQIIKKKKYVVVKNYVDYSVVFILTKLIAVYLYTASMLFFWGGGSLAGQRPTERQKCPKTIVFPNVLRTVLTASNIYQLKRQQSWRMQWQYYRCSARFQTDFLTWQRWCSTESCCKLERQQGSTSYVISILKSR